MGNPKVSLKNAQRKMPSFRGWRKLHTRSKPDTFTEFEEVSEDVKKAKKRKRKLADKSRKRNRRKK